MKISSKCQSQILTENAANSISVKLTPMVAMLCAIVTIAGLFSSKKEVSPPFLDTTRFGCTWFLNLIPKS